MSDVVRKLLLISVAISICVPVLLMAALAVNREEVAVSVPQVVQINESCSGFIADYGFVVTARHCIDGMPLASIKFYDGLRIPFVVAKIGKDMDTFDYAVLTGDTRGITPLKITAKIPAEGELCAHIGHGGASPQQLMIRCQVGANTGYMRGYIKLNSTAIGGDSGSMVINDNEEVFGILVRSRFPVPITLAVRASHARKAIQDLKK